jgi:nucleoid DNA-binding protein
MNSKTTIKKITIKDLENRLSFIKSDLKTKGVTPNLLTRAFFKTLNQILSNKEGVTLKKLGKFFLVDKPEKIYTTRFDNHSHQYLKPAHIKLKFRQTVEDSNYPLRSWRELIELTSKNTGCSIEESRYFCNAIIGVINQVKTGAIEIQIENFGVFYPKLCNNLPTVTNNIYIGFKPSKSLNKRINLPNNIDSRKIS